MTKIFRNFAIFTALALAFALPASAQFGTVGSVALSGACKYQPTLGVNVATGILYVCGTGHTWVSPFNSTGTFTNKTFDTNGTGNVFKSKGTTVSAVTAPIGVFQGVTATAITDTNFNVLTGPAISVAAGTNGVNLANKALRIKFSGVYTNAAASLLNVDVALCTVSGCATGTVVAPAGCVVTSTNQANTLTAGQFEGECILITATTGAAGTLMAKSSAAFNLGATTAAVLSRFGDTATAVSAAVDLTVAEFIHPRFKYSTSNAGNTATLQALVVEVIN